MSLTLERGEIRAVCGENGAGKSTLMKALTGVVRPGGGQILIDGKTVTVDNPQTAQQLGIALVAQELSLAPHLSILDNIWLGDRSVPLFHRRQEFRHRAAAALRQLDVDYDLDTPVAKLTIGQRQIVEIARLLVRNARILILDEPTATLSDVEIERMMAALRRLKAEGKGVLYVTHRLGEVFDICDSVSVLRNGVDVGAAPITDISRQRLIEMMLGRSFREMYPEAPRQKASGLSLQVEHLAIPGAVRDLSFSAPRGRITCIAGQVGAGAGAIIRAIAGLVPDCTGRLVLDGRELPIGSVGARVKRNITFISEDRAGEGIFRRSVMENLVAARLPSHSSFGLVSWKRLRHFAGHLSSQVKVDAARLGANAFDLSGGNQQKLLFARAMGGSEPGVLLINEPCRGVDVGARAEIYRLLREFCRLGYALLITSSDLEEVVGISDTVITLFRGELVASYERPQIDISRILSDITQPGRPKAA
ncbi:MAG: sugar ABC transporter ATP-binding protein [Rhizobiales bacterium]|nr:sugar ABC transporter ATP-binding protein [Hyphomicrobiales bacterium]